MRYRVDIQPEKSIRRRADIVFPRKRIAVFIDGCFWHGCPQHGTRAFKTNADYWNAKITRNVARDIETSTRLAAAGWRVLRYWEHTNPNEIVANVIEEIRRVD